MRQFSPYGCTTTMRYRDAIRPAPNESKEIMEKKNDVFIFTAEIKHYLCIMRINNSSLLLAAGILLVGCGRPKPSSQQPARTFTPEVTIRTTPVKDQGRSSLCWIYAMLATIESERLERGDSVELSPDYLARMVLRQDATAFYLTRGARRVTTRGMMTMVPQLMQTYGIQTLDAYHTYEPVNYNAIARTMMMQARAAGSLRQLNERTDRVMDRQIGYLPPTLYMLGMRYTPRQFAESVCLPGDYQALTSFTHHPFHERFVLESPDNRMRDTFYNIPIDRLMQVIVTALRHGHAVCWEGDISEPGFNFRRGVAMLQPDDQPVTQQSRQRAYEHFLTTDDHCMELCGLARDASGRRFFLAKNSWGRDNAFGGMMYLSYNYVKMKTIAVMVPTYYQHDLRK